LQRRVNNYSHLKTNLTFFLIGKFIHVAQMQEAPQSRGQKGKKIQRGVAITRNTKIRWKPTKRLGIRQWCRSIHATDYTHTPASHSKTNLTDTISMSLELCFDQLIWSSSKFFLSYLREVPVSLDQQNCFQNHEKVPLNLQLHSRF